MSLPNGDDDENGRPPWRNGPSHSHDSYISPTKKLLPGEGNDSDDRTADETSVGSMSYASDMTSVAPAGTNLFPPTPVRQEETRPGIPETPISALTANTTNESDDHSIQSGVSFNTEGATAIQLRREQNQRQLQRLGVASGATFALFLYMLVPTALLLSMILFGSVSSTFIYQLASIMRWEFHRSILEGRGIEGYLPEGLFELLTSTSVHDVLSDPDGIFGASEHLPYLMLYMIPGLTPEQLDQYVTRLDPTHQRLLRNQQGLLGFLLNRNNHRLANPSDANRDSTLMRFIMGDEGLREWREQHGTQQQQQEQQQLQNSSNSASRRLDLPPTIPEEDPQSPSRIPEEETTGAETIPVAPSTGIPATVATVANPPPSDSSSGSSSQPSPQRRPSATGEMVLFDAVSSAMFNIVGDATSSVRERAQETVRDTLAVPIYRVSLGVTALGLGVGALGLANGTYDLRSLATPFGELVSSVMTSLFGVGGSSSSSSSRGSGGSSVRLSLSMPPFGVLVGSTIASGTTAVVLGLFGTTRSSSSDDSSSRGNPPTTASATKSEHGKK